MRKMDKDRKRDGETEIEREKWISFERDVYEASLWRTLHISYLVEFRTKNEVNIVIFLVRREKIQR